MTKAKHIILHNPIEKRFSKVTRYHYYIFFFIFTSKIAVFWHVLSLIFLSPPMNYTCEGSNLTNVCPCEDILWDRSIFTETMQTKYGLYCDTSWLISLAHTFMYIGLLIGAFIFGVLSDKFGRLSAFTLSCLILGVSGCLLSVMPTAPAFLFMRSIEGIGTGGAIVTSFVLCIEYCSVKDRELITALYHIPINISQLTLPGISYGLRNFDDFQLAISVPMFLFVIMRWLVMESPMWLMDSGRIDEAVVVMEKFETFNGRSCENIREEIEEFKAKQSSKSLKKISFFHIFKHRRLALNLCFMSVIYFLTGMCYYGVSIFIGKMSGNIFANVALSGALLIPGTVASVFLLKTLPRRIFLIGTLCLSGLFILIEVVIPHTMIWLRVILACFANCFYMMCFIIVFLYGVELFPTSIRNSVLGFLSVLSRVGQITGPLINLSSEQIAGITFGVLSLLGTIFVYFLPETKNIELPSSLEDSKSLTRKKSHSIEKGTEESNGVRMVEK